MLIFVLKIYFRDFIITLTRDLLILQDMREMKNCYDGLLSAAAATANCAFGKDIYLFTPLFHHHKETSVFYL